MFALHHRIQLRSVSVPFFSRVVSMNSMIS